MMLPSSRWPLLLPLALLLAFSRGPATARADWEAAVTATSSTKDFPRIEGKFYAKSDRFRVDSPYPFEMSLYARNGSPRVYAAVHSFRIRLSSSLREFARQLPECLARRFADCAARLRLKKVGEEACPDGKTPRTCEVYEGKPNSKDVKKAKLWHWKGEKEPIVARAVITRANGSEIRAEFSGISRKARPDSHYAIPSTYKDAGSLERFFGDLKGEE